MANPSIGQLVRRRREALRLTRDQLAHSASVSVSMIARIELQNHSPNSRAFARIADALECPIDELIPPTADREDGAA